MPYRKPGDSGPVLRPTSPDMGSNRVRARGFSFTIGQVATGYGLTRHLWLERQHGRTCGVSR